MYVDKKMGILHFVTMWLNLYAIILNKVIQQWKYEITYMETKCVDPLETESR